MKKRGQNRTNGKKIGGKSAIKHKKVHLTRTGGMGCKIAQKKRGGAKSHN